MKTKLDFLTKAVSVHGNKYDYSNIDYVNTHVKIVIKCNCCGNIFNQTPHDHLQGHGCPYCARERARLAKLGTREKFIEKATEIHGDRYDYSKVTYRNNYTKVCIICKEHGEFWQTPNNHLIGQGCSKCSCNCKLTTEEFKKRAIKIHGNKYDYSLVNYVNAKTLVKIICKEHGEYEQTPDVHLRGCGCPKCNISHLEDDMEKFLNENNIEYIYQAKFPWLGRQSLDFFLPKYNIAIECQGIQHFEGRTFGNTKLLLEETLSKQQVLDKEKKDKLEEHNINIIYYSDANIKFPYTVFKDKKDILSYIQSYGKKEIY